MLQLHSISLLQFKNYTNRSFDFTNRIVGICGNNGVGKTNLLDAIQKVVLLDKMQIMCCMAMQVFD